MSVLNRPFRLWHGLVVIGAAFAAGSAGSALAGDERSPAAQTSAGPIKLHYVSSSLRVDANSQEIDQAHCPRGTKVSGGGVAGGAGFNGGRGQMVNTSEPFDDRDDNTLPDNGWLAAMDNFHNADDARMITWAICVD